MVQKRTNSSKSMGNIQHRGIVESVEGNRVVVIVEQQSACAGCHAQGVCSQKGERRTIEVATSDAKSYSVGDKVVVALLNRGMALSSVVMGYLLPLVVLLATLLLLKAIGLEDGVVALGAIGAVALYYLLLYILRREIEKKIEFTIFKE